MTLEDDQKLRRDLLFSSLEFFGDPKNAIAAAFKMEHYIVRGADAADPSIRNVRLPREKESIEDVPGPETEHTKKHARWTETEDAQLAELWNGDVMPEEIGQCLGRTLQSVNARARKLGLSGVRESAAGGTEFRQEPDASENGLVSQDSIQEAFVVADERCQGECGEAGRDEPADHSAVASESKANGAGHPMVAVCTAPMTVGEEVDGAEGFGEIPPECEVSMKPQPVSVRSTIGMIVDFLRANDFCVERLDDGKYKLDGDELLTAKGLVQRANDQRCFLGKPQFDVELKPVEVP